MRDTKSPPSPVLLFAFVCVLGRDEFVERARNVKLVREVPRHQRRVVQIDPDRVIGKVANLYGIAKDEVLRGYAGRRMKRARWRCIW